MNAVPGAGPKGHIEGVYSSLSLFFIGLFTRLVPRWLFPPCAFATGALFYLCTGERRRGIRANLRVVTGRRSVESLVLATYYKFARNWCDIMLMLRLTGERLERLILPRSEGRPLADALADGNGAIIITPHLGNWELGGLGLAERGYRVNVMTFREPDEKMNAMREAERRVRGIGTIYVDRDATSPLAIIEAARGQFQCDCRGVGSAWQVAEVRMIATALLGSVDLIAKPDQMAADFGRIMQQSMGRGVADASLRVWAPQGAQVLFVRQVSPTVEDLTTRRQDVNGMDHRRLQTGE